MPRHLPPGLITALIPVLVLVAGLDIFCLVDLVRAKSVRNAPRLAWAIVIVFVSAPIGAVLYLYFGMDRGSGTRRAARAARTELGPGSDAGTRSGQPKRPDRIPAPRPGAAAREPALSGAAADSGAAALGREAAGGELVVQTRGLTRDYGGAGLFEVDLAVPRGCVYGLVGMNGAGKTTLLSILSGIRRSDRGTVTVRAGAGRVAVCPDVAAFDGWLTADEVVDLARSLTAPSAGRTEVARALRTAGLADAAGRRVGGFSRGMTQRLGLACALVADPELLILDEPMSALDPAGRAEMLSLVEAMRGEHTVIFSSHILSDVQRIADQVGILRDGRLLYQGATQNLIDHYLTPSWLVRISGELAPVAAALAAAQWATAVAPAGPETLRVDATTIEAGELGIPSVLAACGARQVSCEPAAADLESAFLALTGGQEPR
jgi:ABC-2 type transport system ATP-binding protein